MDTLEMPAAPDLQSLSTWMSAQDGRAVDCTNLHRLQAGTQNLMLSFERAGARFVFRQPPAQAIFPPAKIVSREVRVLNALEDSRVPHPAVFGGSIDEAVLGGPFYIMAAVDGFNAVEGLPPGRQTDADFQGCIGRAAVDALVALSRFDAAAAGLSDLGNAQGFLERQVARWRKQLQSYSAFAGWSPEGSFENIDAVGTWLSARQPNHDRTGLIHGDFHLGNMLFRLDGTAVAAVIDWELATIGDPLIDLGWLIATWPTREGADTGSGIVVPGATALPSTQALLDHYQAETGEDLDDITWFVVLACYKLGIIQEGSWARALVGQADRDIGAQQHHRAMAMIRNAQRLIGAKTSDIDPKDKSE